MSDKIHLYEIRQGVFRCQKQINSIRFVKDFYGTEKQCETQARAWWEDIKSRYRDNWDGTKTWDFFQNKMGGMGPLGNKIQSSYGRTYDYRIQVGI